MRRFMSAYRRPSFARRSVGLREGGTEVRLLQIHDAHAIFSTAGGSLANARAGRLWRKIPIHKSILKQSAPEGRRLQFEHYPLSGRQPEVKDRFVIHPRRRDRLAFD